MSSHSSTSASQTIARRRVFKEDVPPRPSSGSSLSSSRVANSPSSLKRYSTEWDCPSPAKIKPNRRSSLARAPPLGSLLDVSIDEEDDENEEVEVEGRSLLPPAVSRAPQASDAKNLRWLAPTSVLKESDGPLRPSLGSVTVQRQRTRASPPSPLRQLASFTNEDRKRVPSSSTRDAYRSRRRAGGSFSAVFSKLQDREGGEHGAVEDKSA
ncbi:hypothetical protein SCP_1403950 [Sparassis crispa]|uniref:Uncharacterized protein n=1 Tax=Sparassis crispa TaxID=139825 RepID=A0A401H3I2_9APHY|nr:hypothetical protein SCP_1403950 [Sparassis crispa]GBE88987.1 hypothetical protein SCP_1403950 [Sparassis crispa]